eukprot:CAMPEP_0178403912 /NCGR_PEP_ID=MMETSP0689_2-20121128/17612_1 /TAXON_ID=160604 /ORGANISM="Amphidinium massartii, Strain CS-259" /LENGTH=338 /DNA_ID=CAMNT_0020024879 /DNA_START=96 /DNA_END=1109 /DNA_ORIENTATION=-
MAGRSGKGGGETHPAVEGKGELPHGTFAYANPSMLGLPHGAAELHSQGSTETGYGAEPEMGFEHMPDVLRNLEIPESEIEVIETVDYGSTCVVSKGLYKGEVVALKELTLSDDPNDEYDEGAINAFQQEIELWSQIAHPNILELVGIVTLTSPLRLVSEGSSMFELLHNHWEIRLSWPQRLTMLYDTTSAVNYLHTRQIPIIHRDLKSLNVFLKSPVFDTSSEIMVRLADFGFSRTLTQEDIDSGTLTVCAGTLHWMAPEVATGRYNLKADTFSLGIIMYEVMCRHMAYEDLEPEAAAERYAQGSRPPVRMHDNGFAPKPLAQLMAECWQADPDARPP